jgi:hypothetical protein
MTSQSFGPSCDEARWALPLTPGVPRELRPDGDDDEDDDWDEDEEEEEDDEEDDDADEPEWQVGVPGA